MKKNNKSKLILGFIVLLLLSILFYLARTEQNKDLENEVRCQLQPRTEHLA